MFDSESSSDGGWIQWFCDLEGHEFFVEVEIEYIKDTFNIFQILLMVVISLYSLVMALHGSDSF